MIEMSDETETKEQLTEELQRLRQRIAELEAAETKPKQAEAERERLLIALERRSTQLQTAAEVSRAASSILKVDELVKESVNLIRDHFDFYYVGLFLMDEGDEFAFLRAGSGEAGQAMLESGHKLEIGGESMIGQCVAHRQARIALDVGQEAVRFDNPLLPDTRSEMALPLTSRGEVLGALTVQSTKTAAFSEEDIAALQTMADQVANAIANARQFEMTERVRAETDKRVRELGCLNDIGRKVDENLSLPELLTWVVQRIPAAMQYPDVCVVAIEFEGQVYGVAEATSLPCQVVQSLLIGRKPVGRLYISYTEERDFLEEESALMGDIVRRVSGYIESRRLFQEARSRAERLAVVNRMASAAGATLHLDDLMETVYREIVPVFQADAFFISFYDEETDEMDFRFVVEEGIRESLGRIPLSGLTSLVVTEKKPLIIRDLEREQDSLPVPPVLLGTGKLFASWLGAPMLVGERVIGVINVQSHRSHAWDEEDEQLLFTIADQVAVALENSRLFEETRTRAEEQAVLNELGQALTARLNVEQVLDEAYRGASRLVDTTNFYIALYDQDKDEVTFAFDVIENEVDKPYTTRQVGQGLTEQIISTRRPLLIEEDLPERLEEMGLEPIGRMALSWLGVPLIISDQVLGVMAVQSYTTPRLYGEHDLDLLTAIASPAAIAIQNARLFERAQQATVQMGERVRELDCLNDIGRNINEAPPIAEFLQWVAQRIPPAMRYPDVCLAAIEFEGRVYGVAEAVSLPCQIVQSLRVSREQVGRVYISYTEERDFIEEESALLGDIVRRVSSYIENQRLLRESQSRAEEMAVLNEMSRALTMMLDVDAVIENIYHHVSRLIATTNFYVALYDAEQDEVSFPLYAEGEEIRRAGRRRAGKGLTEQVIRTREPLLIGENVAARLEELGIEMIGMEALSWLGVPLMVGQQVIGVIAVQSYTIPRLYDERDRDLLAAIANQAAVAIQNARLFEQAQAALEQVQAVHQRYLRESWESYLGEGAYTTQPAYLYDQARVTPQPDLHLPEVDQALARKEVVVGSEGEGGGQTIALPISLRGQTIGALAIEAPPDGWRWSGEEIALIEAVSAQLALALENTRLFEETQMRVQRERILRETTERVRASGDMESLLRSAVQEIRRALGASRATIRLGLIEEDEPRSR